MPYGSHVFHVYALRSPRRDALQQALQAAGVQTGIHYPFPVHLLEAWKELNHQPGDFPVSERVAAEELSLPMFPELTLAQIETVASAIRGFNDAGQG
jgi:dTDP-4-amino-4,6-dideoxygalactose transaminase